MRRRAICNAGRLEVAVDGIETEVPGISVLGGSTDHLILDVEESAVPVKAGDEPGLRPDGVPLLALEIGRASCRERG